jgi:hypothetical protein
MDQAVGHAKRGPDVAGSGHTLAGPGQNAHVSRLLIITGPRGSGKYTVSRLAAEHFDRCAFIEGDSFFGFVVRGYVDPWLPNPKIRTSW